MEALHAIATSIGVIGLILLMVLLVLHFFGPKTAAWIRSNREEKIGFSKNRVYHANGYLVSFPSNLSIVRILLCFLFLCHARPVCLFVHLCAKSIESSFQ